MYVSPPGDDSSGVPGVVRKKNSENGGNESLEGMASWMCGVAFSLVSWIPGPALMVIIAFLPLLPLVSSIVDGSREGGEKEDVGGNGRALLGYQHCEGMGEVG